MTTNEAFVGLIVRQIKTTRKISEKLGSETERLFNMIEEFIGDVSEVKSEADNADNLADAITCYIDHGEYTIEDLKRELLEVIQERKPNA